MKIRTGSTGTDFMNVYCLTLNGGNSSSLAWLMTTAVKAMDVRQIAMMVDVTFFIFSPPKKIPSVHRCHWLL